MAKEIGLAVAAMLEINAMAFAFGFVRGYYGEKKLLNLPVEVWAGTFLHALGFYFQITATRGPAGEMTRIMGDQFHNLGNGPLALYFGILGGEMGADYKAAKDGAAPKVAGMLGPGTETGAEPQMSSAYMRALSAGQGSTRPISENELAAHAMRTQ